MRVGGALEIRSPTIYEVVGKENLFDLLESGQIVPWEVRKVS
jgi:hypothetical protein